MYNKILLPVDLGEIESQKRATETAMQLAKVNNASLYAMTVVPDFGTSLVGSFFPKDYEKTALAEAQKHLSEFCTNHLSSDLQIKEVVAYGSIYSEIIRYAKKETIDLIVMQSVRHGLSDFFIGPNAARVMRHAQCSVLVARP